MLTVNQVLQQGRYRIISPRGQNGTSADYEVLDTALNANVTIREIPVGLKKVMTGAQMESLKLAFADGAKYLMQIGHPALLKVHGYFSEIDCHYLVSEFVDGSSLSEMLERFKKPFPLAEVSNWADSLLDALNYLHTLVPPVIHQAVNPQNIKLTSKGEIKLLVFNIAENRKADVSDENKTSANLNYLPLEQIWSGLDTASQKVISNSYDETSQQILEKPADVRSDIYALGATLYQLLTAQLPVDALERSIEILEGKPDPLKPPHEINREVPAEISEILMKALEIRRENRFHSAVIMRQIWRTAFVRVKEREAKQEEDFLEIPTVAQNSLERERQQIQQQRLKIEAEQKRLEEERRMVEQERLKIEAEQKRQAELIARQRRETEDLNIDELNTESEIDFPEIITAANVVSETAKLNNPADEFNNLFAEPPKESKVFKRMAAFAAALVVLVGAAFGVWFFTVSNTAESKQTTASSEQTAPSSLNVETVTVSPKTENTPEANPSPSTSPEVIQTSANLPTVKSKTLPTATPKPEVKKQVAATKTPEVQKKPVTVDDLINDN